jgi:hypothetical protein
MAARNECRMGEMNFMGVMVKEKPVLLPNLIFKRPGCLFFIRLRFF